ncbi:hypothetical protein WNY77_04090 [Paraglaciecola mesophila]|uniref:Uncharacterized protein n=1 Tax=Paraglaciecola mesophila TaxID=197222 RepID=A0ABU9SSY5_9ALTE
MKNKISISNSEIMDLVSDGAMANPYAADGRLIPHLILDTHGDNSLLNLVKMHSDSPPGDVESRWASKRFSKKFIYLSLTFERPVEFKLAIEFETNKHSALIDGIIQSRAVYIQPGKTGDKLSHDVNAPKILVEIPAKTTFNNWDDILVKSVKKRLKKEGVSRKELSRVVSEYISTTREVWGRRLRK